MKRYFILSAIMIIHGIVQSQNMSARLGNKQFEQFNYIKAIEYYEHSIKKDSLNIDIIRNMTVAYEKTMQYANAKKTYQYLVEMDRHSSEDWLNYGHFLNKRGNYQEAVLCYKHYKSSDPNAQIEDVIEETKLKLLQKLKSFPANIQNLNLNTSFSEFGPMYYNNDLIFASGRRNSSILKIIYGWDSQFYLNLFNYNRKDKTEKIKNFAPEINSRFHEGGICFSTDYKTMYFTRNNFFKGKIGRSEEDVNNLKIFKAEEQNGKWEITGSFPYNSDEYSVGHPCLSPDGKTMYFVSDMPGGLGSTDIYRCKQTPAGWSQPENLGNTINTTGAEMFPYTNHSNHLFFASDGHAGLGGLDLYVADFSIFPPEVKHLGSPLSSKADDFSLIIDNSGKQGYFASNRTGGIGADDLYAFQVNAKNGVQIRVKNSVTNELLQADTIRFTAQEDASLSFNKEQVYYQLKLNYPQHYSLSVEKKGFEVKDTNLHYASLSPLQTHDILLVPKPEKVQPVFRSLTASVYFDFDRHSIRNQARDTINKVVDMMKLHQNIFVSIEANTDIRGTNIYNQELAKKRANAVLNLLLNEGIDSHRMQTVVLGEEKPLTKKNGQSLKDWHQSNRRVDLILKEKE